MTNNRPEKLLSKDYVIVILASTGISFCNYFFLSTLPIYAQKLTGSTAYSGLMIGTYTFAALAIRPVTGILSDKFGRTRLLILGALICSVVCTLYNFATVLILLIFIRILHGIGFGIHSTSGGAVAADVIPKSRMAEGIGYFGLYSTLATAVAPGIALSIIGNGETQNFKALFILAAAVSLASMIFDCFITYERKNKYRVKSIPPVQCPGETSAGNLPKTLLGFEYAVFMPALVIVLLYIALSSVIFFLPLFCAGQEFRQCGTFFYGQCGGTAFVPFIFGEGCR